MSARFQDHQLEAVHDDLLCGARNAFEAILYRDDKHERPGYEESLLRAIKRAAGELGYSFEPKPAASGDAA